MPATRLKQALSSFVARSSQRDAEIDAARFSSLNSSIGEAIEAIAAERSGLVQRVKRTVEDPVSPQGRIVGHSPSLTEFMIVENRLRCLDRQLRELARIRDAIRQLS